MPYSSASKPNVLLVARLEELWDPISALGLISDTSWLQEVEPLSEFREQRDDLYHKRRVKFFVEQLQSGVELDPIEVDNFCDGHHVYPVPIVDDGNHRLIAHILAKRRTILAHYGGRVDLLRYLEGKRKSPPDE